MSKVKFCIELADLLEKYKLDKITGIEKRKLAIAICNLIMDLNDLTI